MNESTRKLKIAIVSDQIVVNGGAEKVLDALLSVFPEADIFSTICKMPAEEYGFWKYKHIKTTFLNDIPMIRKFYKYFLPLYPMAIESLNLSGYDIVISSSHSVAKGVITSPKQIHICYCHSPMRYIWDQAENYKGNGALAFIRNLIFDIIAHYLRLWDVSSSSRVDLYIANSSFVRSRIKKYYRRDSKIVHPPVDTNGFSLGESTEDYFIVSSRLVEYKNIIKIVEAFSRMPEKKLIVIGDGPERKKIEDIATKNVEIMGYQPKDVLVKKMQSAIAFIFAGEEDFGISLVEAQACGLPLIAYAAGGALDIVEVDKTGIFFHDQSIEGIVQAVREFEIKNRIRPFSRKYISESAQKFSYENFFENIELVVESSISEHSRDRVVG